MNGGVKMSNNEMEVRIQKLLEWEALAEEAKAEADMIRDEIKCEMMDRGTEELMAGRFIVRWTSVLSNRFDSAAFKKQYGDLYKHFTKQVSSKRFSIAA
jgi:predicted phage-related endonuclease